MTAFSDEPTSPFPRHVHGCRLHMADIGTPLLPPSGGFEENSTTDLICALWSVQEGEYSVMKARWRLPRYGLYIKKAFVEANCSFATQRLVAAAFDCAERRLALHAQFELV